MDFYSHTKENRKRIAAAIADDILSDFNDNSTARILEYFAHGDTYIRKAAYIAVGNIVKQKPKMLDAVIKTLNELITHSDHHVRQTAINASGEIGKREFESVEHLFDKGLLDVHHSPRNAVIGSIKKMGEVNPVPILEWSKKYLNHPDKEIRREICHGIELRGRTHPQDILPLLETLQHDETSRVRKTLVHVIGQISYKKGCLETVLQHLKQWDNQSLVNDALKEIVDVHDRYQDFATLSTSMAKENIRKVFKGFK